MTLASAVTINRCQALAAEGKAAEALRGFEVLLRERPGSLAAVGGAAHCLLALGRASEAHDCFKSLAHTAPPPHNARAWSASILSMQYAPGLDERFVADRTFELAARFGPGETLSLDHVPVAMAPLRVGFVSPDLSDHPVGLLLLPLLLFVNRALVHPVLYSTGGREDATRASLRRFCEWHDIQSMDHDAQLRQLRSDRLDILIDLAGHTAGNSLPVFARRAAPLQLSWLGYFDTTGVPAMDAVLMDAWHVPPEAGARFSEEVLRLPHTRWCYNPVAFAPEVSASPASTNGFVTFGSFNNTAKYNEMVFGAWARILAAVPSSRLVLKWQTCADPEYRESVWIAFERHGIDRRRVELRARSPHLDVLQQYAGIDIALDPFPFTGGYTSCESLWMGLPLITLCGDRTVSRQGYALVSSLGRQDWSQQWIATDIDSYVRKAVALASSPDALARTRMALRPQMKASPLMNGRRFAEDFTQTLLAWRQRKLANS